MCGFWGGGLGQGLGFEERGSGVNIVLSTINRGRLWSGLVLGFKVGLGLTYLGMVLYFDPPPTDSILLYFKKKEREGGYVWVGLLNINPEHERRTKKYYIHSSK